MSDIRATLMRSRLFLGADKRLIERCSALFAVRTFPRGRRIFYQEDSARFVRLISSGLVRLSYLLSDGHEISLAIVGAGDLVGEEALVGEPQRPLIATALEDCQTVSASGEDLARVFSEEPQLAMNLARYTSLRYSEISMALEETMQGKVRDRLLRTLRRLALQHGVISDGGRRIEIKLTHLDIATFVASTRETVSLELAALTRIGSISRGRGTITVPNREFDVVSRHVSEKPGRGSYNRRRGWVSTPKAARQLT